MNETSKSLVRRASRAGRLGAVLPLTVSTRLYGGTDKGRHGYTGLYAQVFKRHRYRQIGVIEIGVGGYANLRPGGSIRLWLDYFPRARVVGIDLHKKALQLGPRVAFVQGDQTDPVVLERAVEALAGYPLAVVIDDGSHAAGHALASLKVLFPRLVGRGVYAVEDLHTSYWPTFGGAIPPPENSALELGKRLVEDVQFNDPTFARHPDWGPQPSWSVSSEVEEVHVRPGLLIAVKAAAATA